MRLEIHHKGTKTARSWVRLLALLVCLIPRWASAAPDIVLITIDTLRADHLGCYGYRGGASPNLDKLAASSLVFRKAFSAVPLTLPSHATLLTGLYPNHHGMRDNAAFPRISTPMLAERLRAAGYHTAAFVSGAPLLSSFGLNRGFETYNDDFEGSERHADQTTDQALEWLKQSEGPRFLWIHYFDPHAPYDPPPEFKRRFSSNLYDGEIAFVDQQISRVLAAAGNTSYVIVTADHGESLGEHGEKTHGVFLYNATLRVPLLLAGPGLKPQSREDPVSLVDMTPTVLKLAGLEAAGLDGRSLLASPTDRVLFSESLYAQRNFGFAPLFAVQNANQKYIQAPKQEVYDLRNNPTEKTNQFPKNPASGLQRALETYSKPQSGGAAISAEDQEKLRSLGYLGGNLKAGAIDPKDRIQFIEQFNAAMGLLESQQYETAEKQFQSLAAGEHPLALRFLGDALSAQGKYDEAARNYEKAMRLISDPETGIRLAKCYFRLQQPQKAEDLLQEMVRQFPDAAEPRFELASLYSGQRKWDEAFALLQGDTAEMHNQRGIADLQRKDFAQAAAEFGKAIALQSKSTYWNNLGIADQQLGKVSDAESAFVKGLSLNPEYTECEANLALFLAGARRWSDALPHLQRVTSKNPHLWNARLALGMALEKLNRGEEALAVYQTLLKEAPDNWPAKQQLEQRLKK